MDVVSILPACKKRHLAEMSMLRSFLKISAANDVVDVCRRSSVDASIVLVSSILILGSLACDQMLFVHCRWRGSGPGNTLVLVSTRS